MDSSTHATLLERLRDAEDPLAWDEFCERYARLIHGYARRRGCGEHTAEEIVQEVILAVFEKRDVYRYDPARGRFRDWLGAIARNQVARRRRQPGQRIRAPGGEGPEPFSEPAAAEPGPDAVWEETFEESLLLVLLAVVRQTTSPRTYQAFELFALHGLSGAEVARLTGLSRNAVYQARKDVVKRLKELGATYRDDGRLGARVKRALACREGDSLLFAAKARVGGTTFAAPRKSGQSPVEGCETGAPGR